MPLFRDINTPEYIRLDKQLQNISIKSETKAETVTETRKSTPFSFSASELNEEKNIPSGL